MNIFYLHEDPSVAASYMYDKHVVKMILESAQMLCTAHHMLGDRDVDGDFVNVPYKKAHINHPSTKWVRENSLHYDWLYEHMMALGNEYKRRYGRTHMSVTKCGHLCAAPIDIPHEPFVQPPQCMPDQYKTDDSVDAYWNYYIGEKHSVANKNETIKTQKFT